MVVCRALCALRPAVAGRTLSTTVIHSGDEIASVLFAVARHREWSAPAHGHQQAADHQRETDQKVPVSQAVEQWDFVDS